MSHRSAVDPLDDRIIHLSAELAMPLEEAFAYSTENSLLELWLTTPADVPLAADRRRPGLARLECRRSCEA